MFVAPLWEESVNVQTCFGGKKQSNPKIGGPGGYHGDGAISPANTDARAGHDEQDPSEAHPDTHSILDPVGDAAGLSFLLVLSCTVASAWRSEPTRWPSRHTLTGVSECGSWGICTG